MDSRYLKYAEQNAPRYTSYPTAPHFSGAVDGEVYTRWLTELDPQASVSLYLHTPYCRQMCWYCGCHAFSAIRDEPIKLFVSALLQEVEHAGTTSAARRVTEIHWGGGTPNTLSPEQFGAIMEALRRRFDLDSCIRHAIEIDPRLLTEEQAQTFAAAGVNRASLGVQDLDPAVQEAIGRIQPLQVVADAVSVLRAAAIESISFDLMYGLPKQTLESVRKTAQMAARLGPARVSVFGYAHVPWFKQRQRLIDASALPGAGERFDLAEAIRETLADEGYVAIGYDHYALPDDPIAMAATEGALQRNFQGFVEADCDALIGLGPSAISTLPQGYAQNETEIGAWRASVMANKFATRRGLALSEEDRRRRALIMHLLCDFEVDLEEHGGAALYCLELSRLQSLQSDGLVSMEGTRLSVPPSARPFARLVAQAFDAYAGDATARHSRAV
ncbi:MAG: oxygen-independent coproporphyrinogen III oxidase [Proteobacteria bacterium]|nr:oxygen-independent coproporphyrinogen III oxidase [Pseudomonadota bacterium]